MKKITKLALVLMMLATSAFGLMACDKKVSAISVEGEKKIVLIEGSDLDLSSIVLVVERGGEKEEIALNAEGVSVSGYNKDALGDQTITVTYEGVVTTFTVTVAKRVSVENARKEYLVGEELVLNEGRVRVTKDDGTSFTANLNDSSVTVSGFDSSKAGVKTLNVACKKDGATYEGTFDVTVYAVENVSFKKPTDTIYQSHDTGLDLAGGLITLTGNGGKLTRYVTLDKEGVEISGFDLSVLTPEHLNNPINQTVTVKYMGKTYEFKVELSYSKVSMVRDYAQELKVLDWEQSTPIQITEELGLKALEAGKMYASLSRANQKLISDEDKESVIRAAVVYSRDFVLPDLAAEYENVFTVKGDEITFVQSTGLGGYNAAKEALEKLKEEDNAFMAENAFLVEMRELCGDMILKNNIKVSSYLANIFNPTKINELTGRIEYMIRLHDKMAPITEWTEESLASQKATIDAAMLVLNQSVYRSLADRSLYSAVSSWRENNDYFDILYTYYYHRNELDQLVRVKLLQLPGPLEELFVEMRKGYNEVALISQGKSVDTTTLMLHLQRAQEIQEEILALPDGLYRKLFTELKFADILTAEAPLATLTYYLTVIDYGYNKNAGALLGKEEFASFWEQYLAVVGKMLEDSGYVQTDEFGTDVEQVFDYFVNLSPSAQYGILLSMNPFYVSHSIPENALDYKNGSYTYFVSLLSTHYQAVLPESAQGIFADLLLAVENYSRRYVDEKYEAAWLEKMQAAKDGYTALAQENEADAATFNQYLGELYQAYVEIFDVYESETHQPTDYGELTDEVVELKETLKELNTIYALIVNNNLQLYAMYFASIEHAISLESVILEGASESVKKAYYHEEVEFLNVNWSLEYIMYYFRRLYASYLNSITLNNGGNVYYLWAFYEDSDVKNILAEAAEVMWYGEMGEEQTIELEQIQKSLKTYREADPMSQALFTSLDGSRKSYRKGLQKYLKANLSEEAFNAAAYLLMAEEYYSQYRNNPEGTTFINIDGMPTEYTFKSLFISYIQLLGHYFDETHDKYLSEEERTKFLEIMGDHCNFYVEIHNDMVRGDNGSTEGTESTEGQA